MPPQIKMPDAMLVGTSFLRSALLPYAALPHVTGVRVVTENPPDGDLNAKLVRVRRSGGTRVNLVEDAARLDVMFWHPNDRLRWELAELVRGLLHAATGTVVSGSPLPAPTTIGQVTEFLGPGAFPDPRDNDREIIMLTVEVRLRGAAA